MGHYHHAELKTARSSTTPSSCTWLRASGGSPPVCPHFIKWADAHKGNYDVTYEDITPAIDMYRPGPQLSEGPEHVHSRARR